VGRIDPSLLEREAGPAATAGWEVFACGPVELLDTVERTFARLGVPAAHVHVERFEGA
jgi:ferredoxin-NADP reductase